MVIMSHPSSVAKGLEMARPTEPGIYTLTEEAYHADPCPTPSLSRSSARTLLDRSPRHAWLTHPKLGGQSRPDSKAMAFGRLVHSLLLEGPQARITLLDHDDFRSKAARQDRDQAKAQGLLPVLRRDYDHAMAMVDAAKRQCADHDVALDFTQGQAEQTILWQEENLWCRARIDWLPESPTAPVYDYKTTSLSAHPRALQRRLWDTGSELQAAFYRRGLSRLRGHSPDFRFIVQETEPPYALTIASLSDEAMALAQKRIGQAITLWQRCLRENHWPGYPVTLQSTDAPAWAAAESADR